jgi:hypothetical protein
VVAASGIASRDAVVVQAALEHEDRLLARRELHRPALDELEPEAVGERAAGGVRLDVSRSKAPANVRPGVVCAIAKSRSSMPRS